MVADADELPLVGRTKRMLGVIIPDEIAPDDGGRVHPAAGGMSVSPDSMWNVPNHRRPRSMAGGSNGPLTNRIYAIGDEIAASGQLAVRPDHSSNHPHAFVEPSTVMLLEQYEAALASTRPYWRQVWPER
jgi:hypothetical protein